MTYRSQASWSLSLVCIAALMSACFEDVQTPSDTNGDADTTDSGDGDGDPTTGDGDGDGDGDPTTGDGDGDPTTGDGDGDPTMGDGDGDPTVCDSGYSCVPDPGPAWAGPFTLHDVDEGCGDAYPDQVEALFDDLQVGASSCDCNCGQPNVTCPSSMNVIGYAANNCVNGQGQQAISPNQCYNTFSASHAVSLGNATASCAQGSVEGTLPEPDFGTKVVTCGGFEPGPDACDDGASCVPDAGAGSIGGICYTTEGDVACPAGYPNKSLYATGFDDTRECPDTCSCSASGALCTVSITGYASDNCVSPQGAVSTDSGSQVCAAVSNVVQSIRPGNVTVKNAGMCTPGAAQLSGDVVYSGPVTVCCNG